MGVIPHRSASETKALPTLSVSCPRYCKLSQTAKPCRLRRHFNRRDMIHKLYEQGASVSSWSVWAIQRHHMTPNVTSDAGSAMTFETLLNSLFENVLRSWLHKAPLFQIKAVAKNSLFGECAVCFDTYWVIIRLKNMCTIICYDWKFFLV